MTSRHSGMTEINISALNVATQRNTKTILNNKTSNGKSDTYLISYAYRRPVEDRVLGVVSEAVIEDEGKVCLELLHRLVGVFHHFLMHGEEVHRLLDVARIVRHLE